MEFHMVLEKLPDHTQFHWLDEKDLVNKDIKATKVRADPLTGYFPCIYVNGGFRNAYNSFTIISASPQKISPVAYYIGRDNGNAALFLAFIDFLLQNS
jgi:hypothetical protein